MKHVYYIFITDSPETASMTDTHIGTVLMTQYEVAKHVRRLNELNKDRYIYFMRG
jgi:hypothetical protein